MAEKKLYVSLDIAKYMMAIMILWGHTANEWAYVTGIWHYIFSLAFTVPAFFAISGFLFFSKVLSLSTLQERDQYYKKSSVRLGKMYLVWSLIYLGFNIVSWSLHGCGIETILNYIHQSLTYSTYGTIWFLPALWIGESISYFLYTRCSQKVMYFTIGLLWFLGLIFGPYADVFMGNSIFKAIHDSYISVFLTFRHGLFYATVYVFLGYLVLLYYKNFTLTKSVVYVFLFHALFFAEAVVMKRITVHSDTDMAAFLLPTVFFLLCAVLLFEVKPKKLYVDLRYQSMLLFCGQRLFLSAIPSILPYYYIEWCKSQTPLAIMLAFSIIVPLFAWRLNAMCEKYDFLKILR